MPKILITDDSEFMRELISNMLYRGGYDDNIEASSSDEAIAVYTKEKPDLVLLDVIMGHTHSGLDALREIKRINPDAKVIMITVVDQAQIGRKAKDLGALDYICKPIEEKDFIKVINRALGK